MIDAPDRPAAIRLLRERGITPSSIEPLSDRQARKLERESSAEQPASRSGEAPTGTDAVRTGGFSLSPMSRSDLAIFVRELATATQAGLPLVPSLHTILRTRKSPKHRRVLESIIHKVEHGRSLADACSVVGKPFDDLTINLMRAGELSGRLGEVLDQAATLLERDVKLRRQVVGSTLYPAFLGVLITIAIGIIVGYVVPKLMQPLVGKLTPANIPIPTRIVLAIGQFFGSYWWLAIITIVLALFIADRSYRAVPTRLKIDRFLLRVPILGRVLSDIAVARFTRTFGTLVSSGLPALTALKITRGTLGNKAMERVVDDVVEQVSAGKTISEPMEASGYFPPLLTQVISLGERTGRLAQCVAQATTAFEERVETSLKTFTTVLPPLLLLIAAGAIGFVMSAVLLLVVQLQDIIG